MLKIGDEILVHGYVDEIRKDIIIIRNSGGYFGTIKEEIKEEIQNSIDSKEWIIEHSGNGWNDWINFICPYCDTKYYKVTWYSDWNYCPKCGKKLKLNKEEI